MTDKKIQIYALLAAHSYPKRRYEKDDESTERYEYFKDTFKHTRKVDLKLDILKNYKKIPELSTSKFVTYINKKNKTIVMSIRGTDLTRLDESMDVYTDALILIGQEKERPCYKCAYNNLRKIYKQYPEYKVVLVGHSLGGRLAIDLLDSRLGKKLSAVHGFNIATGPVNLYDSADCHMTNIPSKKKEFCEKRKKLHIHLVNKDPISILSIGDKSKTKKAHSRKKKSSKLLKGKRRTIKKSHSVLNFI